MSEHLTQRLLQQIKGKRPSTLYRQLLRMYIRKFDTDHNTIIKAWKQTKYEFWLNRRAKPEDVEALMFRGQGIFNAIQTGVVPVYTDPKTGKSWCKYDKDTLAANDGQMDPIPIDEWVRRYHDKIPKEELREIQANLVKHGRWQGELEFKDDMLARKKFKVKKHKKNCYEDDRFEEFDPTVETREKKISPQGYELPHIFVSEEDIQSEQIRRQEVRKQRREERLSAKEAALAADQMKHDESEQAKKEAAAASPVKEDSKAA